MEKVHKTGGLWNLLISLFFMLGAVVLAVVTQSTAALALVFFAGLAVLVALTSYVHMHLVSREQFEQLELEEIKSSSASDALFETGDVLPARRSREQYEKWVVPSVAVLALGVQAWALYQVGYVSLPNVFEQLRENSDTELVLAKYVGLFITAMLGLVLFMRGQFASHLSRSEKQRLLQPASDFLLFGAYLNFLLAAVVAVSFKDSRADAYVGVGLTVLMGLLAIENLISMIFEIYRPRMAGRKGRLLYQSRLVELIAKPENLFTTAGKILDYQFGFRVSETWGYQFLRERLGTLIGIQVILLWLSTSVITIQPNERGLLTNMSSGDVSTQWLEPGFHGKLPWPFARVDRFSPNQIHSFMVGLEPDEEMPPDAPELWLFPQGKDYESLKKTGELFFVSDSGAEQVDANLLVASIPVHYRIKDLEKGWMQFSNPAEVLQGIAYREVVRFFLRHNLPDLLREARVGAAAEVQKSIQEAVDQKGLGVEIVFVGLSGLRPPAESPRSVKADGGGSEEAEMGGDLSNMPVAAAVEKEVSTRLNAQMKEYEAEAIKERLAAESGTLVGVISGSAEWKSELARQSAEARKHRLESQVGPYKEAPEMYRLWMYLDTFRKATESARKFVVAVDGHELEIDLDLQESVRRDLFNVKVPKAGNK